MNMLQGTFVGGDQPGVEINGLRLPAGTGHDAKDGQPVIFGIRPEHLDLAEDGFPARISVVEPTGSETMVFLRFGENEIVALFRERHDFKPGDTVCLRPRQSDIHLFDAQSGQRI